MATQQQTTAKTSHSGDDTTIGVPSQFCSVCGDHSTGIHFGGNSCESCKAFFRRSVQCNRYQNYKCSNAENCLVNIVTRKVCQFCRYSKCTKIGMKPKWVLSDQEREEKYGSRRKKSKDPRVNDEDPEIYKFLSKEEKLLIEDIAHALYQSRATYPLQFPSQLNQYLSSLPTSGANAPMPSPSSSTTAEKPPNPSANFLIIPIQRLVLFARMLKDFDLFPEDDKVNLLKGSAIEIMVCSSNTLFNPKTQTFSNYISRDQRASVDDQAITLDPLLKRLWGEDLFEKTKAFLISMCNLHVDEVTSTLLVPVILFSPDRSNVINVGLVKKLQAKYASLLLKFMHWRYGVEKANFIYPKLLLQIINIRTLSLSHAEVIQKVMSTSSVNPLVQEVAARQQLPTGSTSNSRASSFSIPTTPSDKDSVDYDKIPSIDSETMATSDDEDNQRRHRRGSINDRDLHNEDFDETDPRNIWRKRRKLSLFSESEVTHLTEQQIQTTLTNKQNPNKTELTNNNQDETKSLPSPKTPSRRPYDHQVPSFMTTTSQIDETNRSIPLRSPAARHLPPKKQASLVHRDSISDQGYHPMSSPMNIDVPSNLSSFSIDSSTHSGKSIQNFQEMQTSKYSSVLPAQHLTRPDEYDLRALSLGAHSRSISTAMTSLTQAGPVLGPDEQQLINAIHAHPNRRDLVMALLQQLNEPSVASNCEKFPQNRYHQK